MAAEILETIKQMLESHKPEVLVFADLDPSVAAEILFTLHKPSYKTGLEPDLRGFRLHYSARENFLKVVMPTWFHERPIMWLRCELGRWMDEGFIQFKHFKAINDGTPTFDNFVGDYAGTNKIPDLAWIPCVNHVLKAYPSIVLESGWAESAPRLWNDCNLWLTGTAGAVHVVILCKVFYPDRDRKMKATLTMCRRKEDGELTATEWQIFPAPNVEPAGPFITIDELFSGSTPDGLTPTTELPLCLEYLRDKLRRTFHQHRCFAA